MDILKDERFDFTIMENDVLRDYEKFNKNEVLAYMSISLYADKSGVCFPSYAQIAKIMRTTTRTATDAVQGLVAKGVITIQNRKNTDDKKKLMKSNIYTLVSVNNWHEKIESNRKYLVTKAMKYKSRTDKAKVTRFKNQLDKEKAPNSTAIELDAPIVQLEQQTNRFTNDSISQNTITFKEESVDKYVEEPTKNVKMLQDAKIKYTPFVKEWELIESLESDVLEMAIEKTLSKSESKSWNYLLQCYDTLAFEKYNPKKQEVKQFTPKNRLKGGLGMASSTLYINGEYVNADDMFSGSEDFNDYIEKQNRANWAIS